MEGAVQRDPNNTQAWFELGVKQQENERERQAISALQRALELDPTHRPSWLALAISHTNEGDRRGTYQAIQSWVRLNERYRDVTSAFAAQGTGSDEGDEFQKLITCLIAMARDTQGAEVDADVQIALATLLNANEVNPFGSFVRTRSNDPFRRKTQDYHRAHDCFRTALSVRPDVRKPLINLYTQNSYAKYSGLAIVQPGGCNAGQRRPGRGSPPVLLSSIRNQPSLYQG